MSSSLFINYKLMRKGGLKRLKQDGEIVLENRGEIMFVRVKLTHNDIKSLYEKIDDLNTFGESFTWGYNKSESNIVVVFEKVKNPKDEVRKEKSKDRVACYVKYNITLLTRYFIFTKNGHRIF